MTELIMKAGSDPDLTRCVQAKIGQMVAKDDNKTLGERLFADKQLELAPFEAVDFTEWGDWEQDPLSSRNWQWRLNWLQFLSYLMAYHHTSGDDEILDFARDAIRSWLDSYLETDASYPFEFIWHDHATALRAEQFALFAYYCRGRAPKWAARQGEFLTYLEQALAVHGELLSSDRFYSQHTNHGLAQARVLLFLGTTFKGAAASEWQRIGVARISSELAFSFTDEGVHVENSPFYHVYVFQSFCAIIRDYPEEALGNLAEEFYSLSEKALNFITHILRPDGRLPPIGDTQQLPISDTYRDMFSHTLEYQYLLYALSQGKRGVMPQVLNRVYPVSGYAIFRDEWPANEQYLDAFHVVAKVGCSSRYHHQDDEGHISLYAGGEDWLIDSGMYSYNESDPVRKYMRSRQGHNVPAIAEAYYPKEFERRSGGWRVGSYSEASLSPSLTMHLNVMPPVTHRRDVTLDSICKVVGVSDRISAEDERLRDICLQWHFPKDKRIIIDKETVKVIGPTGNKLTIVIEGEVPDAVFVVRGCGDDGVASCISYTANQVEASQLLRVVFKRRRQVGVNSRFVFDLSN